MSIIIFIVVLVLLILVHEFGHFIVAKKSGIRVDEFGIGFPPKLFGKKFGETEYTINALPIGGFVRIYGEDYTDENGNVIDDPRSFVRKSKWIQAAVLVAGVGFNILFAWLLFTFGFMYGMPTALDESALGNARDVRLFVTGVLPDAPAAQAGLAVNDTITGISVASDTDAVVPGYGGVLTPASISSFIAAHPDQHVVFEVLRKGEKKEVTVDPKVGVLADDPSRAAAGFSMTLGGTVSYPPHVALWQGAKTTWFMLEDIAVGLAKFFYQTLTFHADFSQVAGPVGIVGLVGDATALGFAYLITFTAMISLNLAVINILPFPALDGGRLLFVIIESIKGSPIKPSVAANFNRVGFGLLILLMIAVTFHDVLKLIG
jgi:regulator of sigma E protease